MSKIFDTIGWKPEEVALLLQSIEARLKALGLKKRISLLPAARRAIDAEVTMLLELRARLRD